MRSLLLLSAIAAITACSDSSPSTNLPTQAAPSASAQRSPNGPSTFGKPGGPSLNVQVVIGTTVNIAAGSGATATALCPAGTAVTGGGYEVFNLGPEPFVWRNRELESAIGVASGWTVSARNQAAGAQQISLTAWVSCAS